VDKGEGIFVSTVSTSEWVPDPETSGSVHVLCSAGRVEAGLSRFDHVDGPLTYTLPERETFLVLEGRAHIEVAGAESLDLEEGNVVSLPKGAVTTWHLTTPYREFWVFGGERARPEWLAPARHQAP
jgi:uncharacterized cupin superfamily protein